MTTRFDCTLCDNTSTDHVVTDDNMVTCGVDGNLMLPDADLDRYMTAVFAATRGTYYLHAGQRVEVPE